MTTHGHRKLARLGQNIGVGSIGYAVLPSPAVQHVIATSIEIHGEHLVFLNAEGKVAALFLMEIVRSWNVLSCASA
jgi:hypothetical protein